jgi:TP901 family phage tail tape measure protein
MSNATLTWELRVKDMASGAFRSLGQSAKQGVTQARSAIDRLKDSLKAVPGRVLKAAGSFLKLAAAATGLTGIVTAVQSLFRATRTGLADAIKFNKAMVEVSTISDDVQRNLDEVTQQVLDMSTAFGIAETTASKALYQTISAGVTDTADAMELLEGATVLSTGGLADLSSTVDVLTDTINAYGFDVSDVTHINNVFFETVRLGKTTVQELSEGLGVVTPVAAELGVSLEELTSMLATLTKGGIDNTTAIIYMRQALVSVLKPSTEAQELIERLGLEFNVSKIRSDGFIGVLDDIRDKVGDDVYALQTLFPNVRALVPVMALAGSRFEEFNEILAQISDTALDEAAPAMRAFELVMLSSGKKAETLANAFRQGLMGLGAGLIEGLTAPITTIEELQAASFALRDGISGLSPVLNVFAGAMLMFISTMPQVISMFASLAVTLGAPEGLAAGLNQSADSMGMVADAARGMATSLMSGDGDLLAHFDRIATQFRNAPRRLAQSILDARAELARYGRENADAIARSATGSAAERARQLDKQVKILEAQFRSTYGRTFNSMLEEAARASEASGIESNLVGLITEGFETMTLYRSLKAAANQGAGQFLEVAGMTFESLKNAYGEEFTPKAIEMFKQIGQLVDDAVSEGVLSDRAIDNLRRQATKAQQALLQVGGEDLRIGLGLPEDMPDAPTAPQFDEEQLERYQSALKGIEFQIDVLEAASRESYQSQREAIGLATQAALYELEVKRTLGEVSLQQYESMYTAIIEGEANKLQSIEESIQREQQAREQAAQRAIEAEERKAEAAERAAQRALEASRKFVESGSLATAQALSMNDAIIMGAEQLEMLLVNAQAQLDAASMMMQDMGPDEVSVYSEEEIAQMQMKIDLLRDQAMAQSELNDRIRDYVTAQGQGSAAGNAFRGSLQNLATQFSNIGQIAGDLVANQLQALTGGLADMFVGVMDGSKDSSEAWKEFAANFIKGLLQMTMQMLMMYGVSLMLQSLGIPVGVMMGGANVAAQAMGGVNEGGLGELVPVKGFATGGVVEGLGRMTPVRGYATGGPIVNEPHVALIGEGQYNEAVVPLPDGRSIPVQMTGQQDARPVSVNFQIQAFDSKDVTRVIQGQEDQIKSMIMQAVMEDRAFRGRMG